jgi:putative flippase GtrA
VTTRRFSRFVAVGAAGFIVQMAVAAAMLQAGLPPVVATVLAIEAAIVNNHAWHRRWAWQDRSGSHRWTQTLLRAHVGAGATSLVVGAGTVAALSGRVAPLTAQVIAVLVCAIANFWMADRWIFRGGSAEPSTGSGSLSSAARLALFTLCILVLAPAVVGADGPSPRALQSWDRYVAALERAREADVSSGVPAWAIDSDPRGVQVRAALLRGGVDVTRRSLPGIAVQDATLEHWQGSILIRDVTLAQVAQRLRNPDRFPQPRDVLALQVGTRSDGGHDLYLRLARSMIITATYDTWHRVRHRARGPSRLDSTSVATRIEELQDVGTASERRVRLEDSRDFLWRMQSLWRFTAVPGGAIVTCESITLSRTVPIGLGLVSRPLINRVARESMTTALRAWQNGWPRSTPTEG